MAQVKVYGADWCEDTQRSRQLLDRLGVDYEYIDVDANPNASAWVKAQNGGKERKPTIQIGEKILSEPEDEQLEKAVRETGAIHP